MFKHQVEPRAMGEWFYCKGFEQFEYMTTFLLVNESTDYGKLLLICFFFTITLTILMSISIEISWKTVHARKRKTNCILTITSFPWSVFYSY